MEAIVLAAGDGERMGDLAKDKPKHLIKVIKDTAIIDYPMKILLDSTNISRIILNVKEKYKNDFAKRFGDGTDKIKIDYNTDFRPRILDALKNNVDKLNGDTFILIFGDTIMDVAIDKIIDFYNLNEGRYNIVILNPKTYQSIVAKTNKGIIKSLFTKKVNSYNICGMILNKNDINWNGKGDDLEMIYSDLTKKRKLKAYKFFGYYKNINEYKDIVEVKDDIISGKVSISWIS